MLSLDNGLDFDKIAALKPDLIVATNAGVDKDSYSRLSTIAPTIPQSERPPFFEPWKAAGRHDRTGGLPVRPDEGADQRRRHQVHRCQANANPQFRDKKVVLLQGSFYRDNMVATLGWRADFLTQMGFALPDSIKQFGVDDGRAFIPRDKAVDALGAADVLIWTTESDEEQARLITDPTFLQLEPPSRNATCSPAGTWRGRSRSLRR